MEVYYLIIGVLSIESFLFSFTKERKGKGIFVITLILIALLLGSRALHVGHDTANYANIFSNVIDYDFKQLFTTKQNEGMEKGYMVLQWLFGKISHNPSHFYIVIALFEFGSVGYWLWKNSSQPFLSLLVFICMFLTFFVTGIRQSIAISILLWAYPDIGNKRIFPFSIKVLVASLFHATALIFFIAYFIKRIKNTSVLLAGAIVLFPVIYFTRSTLFSAIVQMFERYNDYQALEHGDAVSFTILLLLIAIMASVLKAYGSKMEQPESDDYVFNSNLVAVAIMIMPFVGVNGSVLRIAMYFFVVVCLLVIKMYERIPQYSLRLLIELLSIGVLVYLFIGNASTETYRYEFVGWSNLLWI